jgi:GTP cyclohydrolase I
MVASMANIPADLRLLKPVIADVQGHADNRRLSIDQVGIRGLRHPILVRERAGGEQHTVASCGIYVDLAHDRKGIHMSRCVEILRRHSGALTVTGFVRMLEDATIYLGASASRIQLSFPFFVVKKAPVSGMEGLMDYQVSIEGEHRGGVAEVRLSVVVPVTSLCPCSKDISDYGAHNQRTHITINAKAGTDLWLEDLIDVAEREASCDLYSVLKRPDEKYVTERAYDNPKFVEDIVRDVAAALKQNRQVLSFVVESENFESIHNHSAYALLRHDGDH